MIAAIEIPAGLLLGLESACRAVSLGGRDLLLTVAGGEPRAYQNRCPHQCRAMLDPEREGGLIRCDHHSIGFDAGTGAVADDRGFTGITGLEVVPLSQLDGKWYLTGDAAPGQGANLPGTNAAPTNGECGP